MNDASEVLGVIFECLHKSYASRAIFHVKCDENNSIGSWDCANSACIAHRLFGLDIYERMNCHSCKLESRRLKYTSFFHNINASSLRTAKVSFLAWLNLMRCTLCGLSALSMVPDMLLEDSTGSSNYSFISR
jgi:hypothetical protein